MTDNKRGLSIGFDRVGEHVFLSLKVQGKLTHEDYLTMSPMFDSALAEVKKQEVDVLFDATEFEGWDLRAAWEDFNMALEHGNQFNKIAIYGPHRWQDAIAKIGSWFTTGVVKFFQTEAEAIKWLKE